MKIELQSTGAEIGCTYTQYVEVRRIAPNTTQVLVTSTFEKAKTPDEKRKVVELFLSDDALNTLINALTEVRDDNGSTNQAATG